MLNKVFIGRQPILDTQGRLYGYELLCRDAKGKPAVIGNGDRESTLMLLDTIFNIGVEKLTKSNRAFINVTRSLLMSDLIEALPPANIVLEVLESVEVDAALLERVAKLRQQRFMIALDDYILSEERNPLLELAHIVKLDVRALDQAQLRAHTAAVKSRNLVLLAEKVETREEHANLMSMGFDLFQGYYYARPELYSTQALRPNRVTVLELLARMSEPDVSIRELARLIRNDVAMSVDILRSANSAGTGLRTRVDSIERAVVALGLRTIQNWAGLIALARLNSQPSALLTTVLVRARACELLAAAAGRDSPAGYFTVGLFSLLDVMMETPMQELLDKLPLSDEIKSALREQSGDHGAALACVAAMELGDVAGVKFGGLEMAHAGECYQQAIQWADQLTLLAG
jgi:EAL and modified HD-GYP domain-containing signal transduction protein